MSLCQHRIEMLYGFLINAKSISDGGGGSPLVQVFRVETESSISVIMSDQLFRWGLVSLFHTSVTFGPFILLMLSL